MDVGAGKGLLFGKIGAGAANSVLPLQHVAGQQLDDALDQRVGRGNIVQAEIAIQSRQADPPRHLGMREDALQLGAKINLALLLEVVKRLDSGAIARQHQPALRPDPDGDGEHAAQARKTGVAPMQKSLQDDLGIAVRVEDRAFAFQLLAQLDEIEDLAVVNDHGVAIGAVNRLVTARDVEDGKPRRTEGDLFTLELALSGSAPDA